jgi:hypothetical protein
MQPPSGSPRYSLQDVEVLVDVRQTRAHGVDGDVGCAGSGPVVEFLRYPVGVSRPGHPGLHPDFRRIAARGECGLGHCRLRHFEATTGCRPREPSVTETPYPFQGPLCGGAEPYRDRPLYGGGASPAPATR